MLTQETTVAPQWSPALVTGVSTTTESLDYLATEASMESGLGGRSQEAVSLQWIADNKPQWSPALAAGVRGRTNLSA